MPPTEVIDDDGAGNVETGDVFDPAERRDRLLREPRGHARCRSTTVRRRRRPSSFGEITLLPDDGVVGDRAADAARRDPARAATTTRTRSGSPSTTRSSAIQPDAAAGEGDAGHERRRPAHLGPSSARSTTASRTTRSRRRRRRRSSPSGLVRETTEAPADQRARCRDVQRREPRRRTTRRRSTTTSPRMIVNNLRAPDIIGIEEIQDNDGRRRTTAVVDATSTWTRLIAAIEAAGGPPYEYRQIDPVDDAGRRRAGREHPRRLPLPDRPRVELRRPAGRRRRRRATTVVADPSGRSSRSSPGRVGTGERGVRATRGSRWPASSTSAAKKVFVDRQPLQLEGRRPAAVRPLPAADRFSEVARHGQAQVVNDFVDDDPRRRPEREHDRPRRHQRLRVLGDDRHPRGRRA